MTRELLILRHGKSDWSAGTDDFQRPLKGRGKRAAQRMGSWLQQQQMIPDHIISSPAARALMTARKLCKAMDQDSRNIHIDERLYEATDRNLRDVLATCPASARRVLLVGHNPGLEHLLLTLSGKADTTGADGKLLPAATLARLAMPDDWHELLPGCARLESITRPDVLPRKFPYPGPAGEERRRRPAYYYYQSSVIPYRLRKGKPQILVIASSKGKHLVVPKGIKDPGFTPREAAAKEAWEEAGIEGEVAADLLGEYHFRKWGAACAVKVYPMKVTRMIPEDEWEERHRGRTWMSPGKAAKRLKRKQLRPLMKSLEKML
jgi:phosphohistidine phosphatase